MWSPQFQTAKGSWIVIRKYKFVPLVKRGTVKVVKNSRGFALVSIIIGALVLIAFVGGVLFLSRGGKPVGKFVPQFGQGPGGSGPRELKDNRC